MTDILLLQVMDPVTVKTSSLPSSSSTLSSSSSSLEGVVACIDERMDQVGIRLTGSSVGKGTVSGSLGAFTVPTNSGIYTNVASVTKRRLTKLEELRLRRELGISIKQQRQQHNDTRNNKRNQILHIQKTNIPSIKPAAKFASKSTTKSTVLTESSSSSLPLPNTSMDPPESCSLMSTTETSFTDDNSTVISYTSAAATTTASTSTTTLSLSQIKEKIARNSPRKNESTQQRLSKIRQQQLHDTSESGKSNPPGKTTASLFVGGLHSWAGMGQTSSSSSSQPLPQISQSPPSPTQAERDASLEQDDPEGLWLDDAPANHTKETSSSSLDGTTHTTSISSHHHHNGQEVTELSFYLANHALNESGAAASIASASYSCSSSNNNNKEEEVERGESNPSTPNKSSIEQVLDPWDKILLQSQGIVHMDHKEAQVVRPPPQPKFNVVDPWDVLVQQQAVVTSDEKLEEEHQQQQETPTTTQQQQSPWNTPSPGDANLQAPSSQTFTDANGAAEETRTQLLQHTTSGLQVVGTSDKNLEEEHQQQQRHQETPTTTQQQQQSLWNTPSPWDANLQTVSSQTFTDANEAAEETRTQLLQHTTSGVQTSEDTPSETGAAVGHWRTGDKKLVESGNLPNAALTSCSSEAHRDINEEEPDEKDAMDSRGPRAAANPLGNETNDGQEIESSLVPANKHDIDGDERHPVATNDTVQEQRHKEQVDQQYISLQGALATIGAEVSSDDGDEEEKKEEMDDSFLNCSRISHSESINHSFASLHPLPILTDRQSSNKAHPWDKVLDRLTEVTDDDDATSEPEFTAATSNIESTPTNKANSPLPPLPIIPWDKVLHRVTEATDDAKSEPEPATTRNLASTPANKAFSSTLLSPELVLFVDESTSTNSHSPLNPAQDGGMLDKDATVSRPAVDIKSRNDRASECRKISKAPPALSEDLKPDTKPKPVIYTKDREDRELADFEKNEISPSSVLQEALMSHAQLSVIETPTQSDDDSYSTSSLQGPPSTPSAVSENGEDPLLFRLDETAITVDRTADGLDFTTCLPLMTAINGDDTPPSIDISFMKSYMSHQQKTFSLDQVTKTKNRVSTPTRPKNLPSNTKALLAIPTREKTQEDADSLLYHDPYMASAPKLLDRSIVATNYAEAAIQNQYGSFNDTLTTTTTLFKASERSQKAIGFSSNDATSPESMIFKEKNASAYDIENSFSSYSWTIPSGKHLFHHDQFDVEAPPSPQQAKAPRISLDESLHSLNSFPKEESLRSVLQIDMAGQIKEVMTSVRTKRQQARNETARITSTAVAENTIGDSSRLLEDNDSILEEGNDSHSSIMKGCLPNKKPNKKCLFRWLVAVAGIAIGGTLAVIYGIGSFDVDTNASSASPGETAEESPAASPSSFGAETEKVRIMADKLGVPNQWQESPHIQVAVEWLTQDEDYTYNMNLTSRELEERFALVALYMATTSEGTGNANDWTLIYGFLSPAISICAWNQDGQGVFCDGDGRVTEISLGKF
jgi:hypothetical protein